VSDHGLDVDEGRKPENSNKNRSMTVLPPSAPPATGICCQIYSDNAHGPFIVSHTNTIPTKSLCPLTW